MGLAFFVEVVEVAEVKNARSPDGGRKDRKKKFATSGLLLLKRRTKNEPALPKL